MPQSALTMGQLRELAGQRVELRGWVQTIRDQGGIKFIVLRNRSCTVQLVLTRGSAAYPKSDGLTVESVIKVTGMVKLEVQAPGGVELAVETFETLSLAAPELPIPVGGLAGNEAEQQKRLDWRWLDLRDPNKRLIFEVWTTFEEGFREYWTRHEYIEIHSPKLLSTPSEGAAELFEVDYFDRKAYLAQSPQFYKQMAMASGFERVFEVGPVFRANPSFTSRHDTEFTGYDAEISFVDSHQNVITEEERAITHALSLVKERHGQAIAQAYGRELVVPVVPFPQVTMFEAKELLKPYNIVSEKPGDLNPEEERKLSEIIREKHGHEFVFVTEYPAEVRPFYHMRLESDPSLTKSFDLLWNGIEITTGAQREHRYEKLVEQAGEKGLSLEPLQFYLNFFKYGCPPHGGYGLGPSRMLMKIFGLTNVREVTYLYRGVKRLTP